MAEFYGTSPKKFTKKWWDYFWTYYKWHVIGAVLLTIIFTVFLVGYFNSTKYDVTLTYAGPNYFTLQSSNDVMDKYSPLCPDVNKDGKKQLSFVDMTLYMDDPDLEFKNAVITSLQFSLLEEENYVYILHEDVIPKFVSSSAEVCLYAPVSDWLTVDVGDTQMYTAHDKNYGIRLSGSKILEEQGIDLSDHYLVIRHAPKSKKELVRYKASIEFANKLLELSAD